MKTDSFEFHFDGAKAAADAQVLADLLAREFPGCTTRITERQRPPAAAGTRDAGTTIAILSLIFSATGAAKNTLELAERLIAWAKARRARRLKNPSVVLPPHGDPLPLDQVKPEQLLAAAASEPRPPLKS